RICSPDGVATPLVLRQQHQASPAAGNRSGSVNTAPPMKIQIFGQLFLPTLTWMNYPDRFSFIMALLTKVYPLYFLNYYGMRSSRSVVKWSFMLMMAIITIYPVISAWQCAEPSNFLTNT